MRMSRLQNAIKVSAHRAPPLPLGGWAMPAAATASLAKVAALLASRQTTRIDVNGYADRAPIGPGPVKQRVTSSRVRSQKRTANVMRYVISRGVKPDLVSAHGLGEADPVAANEAPPGRARNRRVELAVTSPANSGAVDDADRQRAATPLTLKGTGPAAAGSSAVGHR
jgi:chemotaxis protein MotB